MDSRRALAVIIGIILIVSGIFVWSKLYKNKTPVSLPQESQKKIYNPQFGYPPGFPAGLPADTVLDVVDNSQKETDGFLLTSVQYVTAESLEGSVANFKAYLQSHGWKIANESGLETTYAIFAQKLPEKLQYQFSVNSINQKHYVSLQYARPTLTAEQKSFVQELKKRQ